MDNYYIVDTDPGIDDLMACSLAVKYFDNKHVMFTSTYGNVSCQDTTKNLAVFSAIFESNAPIYKGVDASMLDTKSDSDYYFGKDGTHGIVKQYDSLPWESKILKGYAPLEIVRAVNENLNKAVIICLGPLTNLAIAVKIDPELPHKISKLILMGGAYLAKGNSTNVAEFNFHCDSVSSHIVLKKFKNILISPFEIAQLRQFTNKEIDMVCAIKTKKAEFIGKLLTTHQSIHKWCSFCDSIAVGMAINEKIMKKSINKSVKVIISGEAEGMLSIDWNDFHKKTHNVTIITDYDFDLLFQMTLESLK